MTGLAIRGGHPLLPSDLAQDDHLGVLHDALVDEWPSAIDVDVETWASTLGRIVRRFGHRKDSGSVVLGVENERGRFIVKAATDHQAVSWLESAARFHAAVLHPAIPTVLASVRTPDGLLLVEEWGDGNVLWDPYDPAVPDREDDASAYARFRALPPDTVAAAVAQMLDAHVAVADAGFVAVDLYDGCVLYDFAADRLSLIDLDMYQPGPYVLDIDEQYGSLAYMSPEEKRRGATVDERSTVYTLGRIALVYLGCSAIAEPTLETFRGTPEQHAIASAACQPSPARRIPTVRELRDRWMDTLA